MGVTAAVGVVLGILLGRSYTVSALAGALGMAAVAVMVVEQRLILLLAALICLLVLVRHIPSIRRLIRGEEERLSRVEDISYKFDEKF